MAAIGRRVFMGNEVNAVIAAVEGRYDELCDSNFGSDPARDERISELYHKLEASLTPEQWKMFMDFDATIAEDYTHRSEKFYKAGFTHGFSTGAVLAI
jgi:hypothetical protein